ncbi:MAG: RNA 2'-phosphotransferase, partial [Verrucomicrobiota bacterium]
MTGAHRKKLSKCLSLILRHDPSVAGLTLDEEGWVFVEELIKGLEDQFPNLDRPALDEVVQTNPKKRFAFSSDGERIRASQGHSVGVDLGLLPQTPPAILYHGTAEHSWKAIQQEGLLPRGRQYVHLSLDERSAMEVGRRH